MFMGKFLDVSGSKRVAACIAKILCLAVCSTHGSSLSQGCLPFPFLPTLSLISPLLPPPRSSTPGLAWMLCRSTPSARPMPTRGRGEPAGRAQVSVSGRSPVPACFPGRRWDCRVGSGLSGRDWTVVQQRDAGLRADLRGRGPIVVPLGGPLIIICCRVEVAALPGISES